MCHFVHGVGGGLCPGEGLCLGEGVLSRGVSVQVDPHTIKSRQYAPYWNAFLFKMLVMHYLLLGGHKSHESILVSGYVWNYFQSTSVDLFHLLFTPFTNSSIVQILRIGSK